MLISKLHIFVEELVLIIIFDYWFECVFIKLQHNLFTVWRSFLRQGFVIQ